MTQVERSNWRFEDKVDCMKTYNQTDAHRNNQTDTQTVLSKVRQISKLARTDIQTHRQMKTETDVHTDRQIDWYTDIHKTEPRTNRQMNTQKDKHTDRQAQRQINGHTDL